MPDPTGAFASLKARLENQAVALKPSPVRAGIDAWFPYYAGYSPAFVRETLHALGSAPGWTVLDPWNGAGTTTAVADSLGCNALGFDLNPVAALVASARLARAQDASHASGLASELLAIATRHPHPAAHSDPLLSWLSPRLGTRFRSIQRAILDLLGTKDGATIDPLTLTPPPLASFFLLCLVRAGKRFLKLKATSNPTWITPAKRGDAWQSTFDQAFLATVTAFAADAEAAARCAPARATKSSVALADCRSLPVGADSVDAVITSPPYCTRIDYFRATGFELAALNIASNGTQLRELRAKAMGTTLIREEPENKRGSYPADVSTLLAKIQRHPSKDSATYYYRNYLQYFEDARQSVGEIARVLKPGACAVLVVQSSYYKELPVPLGHLFCSLAKQAGLRSEVLYSVPVHRVLATINARATKHQNQREYTEDVVAFQQAA